jgi:uncharacterized protein (TIGR02246 family)
MKLNSLIVYSTLLAIAVLAAGARAADPTPEDRAVHQTAQAFAEAFNKADAKAVAALWTPDGDYIIGVDAVEGRDKIQKLYEEFFKAHPGSKMTIDVESVRTIAPNVALEEGTAKVSESKNGPPTASKYSAIHVKQNDGKWLMASVQEFESRPVFEADLNDLAWLIGTWQAAEEGGRVEITYQWTDNHKNFIRAETQTSPKNGEPARGEPASAGGSGGFQIIGRDPHTGQIISWFFNADGGHGFGAWTHDESRWMVDTQGVTGKGVPSQAVNVLHHASDSVMSWQSIHRAHGTERLPDLKDVVFERQSPPSKK